MPVHDWTRVGANDWHDFHVSWISHVKETLNGGLLPSHLYAQAEQYYGRFNADVLTLERTPPSDGDGWPADDGGGGVAVARPKTRVVAMPSADEARPQPRRIAVRHVSGRRLVALIELVSPGNKVSRQAVDAYVRKAVASVSQGVHLLSVDLFPPTGVDPNGLHGVIWQELTGDPYFPPDDEPLTLASYDASGPVAYVEPTAVGHELFPMPLFLSHDTHIDIPLEATYTAALRGVPAFVRELLGV